VSILIRYLMVEGADERIFVPGAAGKGLRWGIRALLEHELYAVNPYHRNIGANIWHSHPKSAAYLYVKNCTFRFGILVVA
jgi:hypothetical protein